MLQITLNFSTKHSVEETQDPDFLRFLIRAIRERAVGIKLLESKPIEQTEEDNIQNSQRMQNRVVLYLNVEAMTLTQNPDTNVFEIEITKP